MSSTPKSLSSASKSSGSLEKPTKQLNWIPLLLGFGAVFFVVRTAVISQDRYINVLPSWAYEPRPLVMQGGDPYIRALMRTISASESNYAQPYSVMYGGKRIADLSEHPNQCLLITTGPNQGDCTTAAGRYQFLTQTWLEKAEKYHPDRSLQWHQDRYRFHPEFQDEVVYNWLMDSNAWGMNIADALQSGNLTDVLQRLSGTWTSLGYGSESNTVSAALPRIYQDMLEDELALTDSF